MKRIRRGLRRLVFGKSYDRMQFKHRTKVLEKNVYMFMATAIFLMMAVFSLMFVSVDYFFKVNRQVVVDYSELNDTERAIAESAIRDLKPQYLSVQKSITFTKNLSKYYEKGLFQSSEDYQGTLEVLLGFNYKQKNYILYDNDLLVLKSVLCHELLHSYFDHTQQAHDVIYDVELYLPCYNSTKMYYYVN